jgi:predicted DNA-binding transcriptional regulator AlpA
MANEPAPTGAMWGPRDVAAYLAVSHSTFMKWCSRGPSCPSLPTPYYRIGGQLRWRPDEVQAWVNAQQVAA